MGTAIVAVLMLIVAAVCNTAKRKSMGEILQTTGYPAAPRRPTVERNAQMLDPDSLRKQPEPEGLHINVRITGEDAAIYRMLEARTPDISDSQRVRDAVRVAAFLIAARDSGVLVTVDGGRDVISHLGVFE